MQPHYVRIFVILFTLQYFISIVGPRGVRMTRADANKIPVKYVLYSHYSHPQEKNDLKAWADGKGKPVEELEGVKFLLSRFASLQGLLTSPGHEGLVVLFFAPGLTECFDGIEEKREDLLQAHAPLRFAEAVSDCVNRVLRENKRLYPRLRFVTSLDLYELESPSHPSF